MIFRIYTDAIWVDANGGEHTFGNMQVLYGTAPDRESYECFAHWLYAMEASGKFERHLRRAV